MTSAALRGPCSPTATSWDFVLAVSFFSGSSRFSCGLKVVFSLWFECLLTDRGPYQYSTMLLVLSAAVIIIRNCYHNELPYIELRFLKIKEDFGLRDSTGVVS